jgi:uncharacterized repeat protein (TIGR01451 family)
VGAAGAVAAAAGRAPAGRNLLVAGSPDTTTPNVGDTLLVRFSVTDKNNSLAQNLHVSFNLSSGLQYASSSVDRGSGCTADGQAVNCDLNFLGGVAPVGNILMFVKVTATGAQTLSATATCQQGVSSLTDATTTVTLNPGGSTATKTAQGVPTGLNGNEVTTKKQDKKAPTSLAVDSSARRGSTAKLKFRIYDDHGVAKALTTIRRGGRLVANANTGFGPVAYGTTYFVGWHVPAKATTGIYTFCVVAVDKAGNKSRASCAGLTVK